MLIILILNLRSLVPRMGATFPIFFQNLKAKIFYRRQYLDRALSY